MPVRSVCSSFPRQRRRRIVDVDLAVEARDPLANLRVDGLALGLLVDEGDGGDLIRLQEVIGDDVADADDRFDGVGEKILGVGVDRSERFFQPLRSASGSSRTTSVTFSGLSARSSPAP